MTPIFLALLALAGQETMPPFQPAPQPGPHDVMYWVTHNGLHQSEMEGEINFNEMSHLLMRSRSKAARDIYRGIEARATD